MEQWVINTLPRDAIGHIVLEVFSDGSSISCDPMTFAALTSAITTTPPTHAALSALPIAAAGWQQYFDAWKVAGYIS